jgi:hypothetical protein
MRIAIFLMLFALPQLALAEIYKFVDENGLVTYTNMPRPGSKPQLTIPDKLARSNSTTPGEKGNTKRKNSHTKLFSQS